MSLEPGKIESLYGRRSFGIKFGLERVRALLARLDDPHRSLAVIHVAGTNGKGSACAMIDSVLRAAGCNVGLYTSPHLQTVNERFRINGTVIDDDSLAELIELVETEARAVEAEHGEVTFFEFTTALAFCHFKRSGVALVVAETGMGGRLDATNVVDPLVSVITRIGTEHTEYLGTTIEEIAGEKCGIIKPGRPVICGAQCDEAAAVVRRTAEERGCRLVMADATVSVSRMQGGGVEQKIRIGSADIDYPSLVLPLAGRHQLENCGTAIAALEAIGLEAGIKIDAAAVKQGLEQVQWPARCQVLSKDPLVLLDGAHNPDAGRVLAVTLRDIAKKRAVGLVLGMCDDKDAGQFVRSFSTLVSRCWTVRIDNERAMAAEELARIASEAGMDAVTSDLPGAVSQATSWARDNDGIVCIAGSLYLAGEVLAMQESRKESP
jgi:dihydrofolate synthase/folylpolyglutamate synthase